MVVMVDNLFFDKNCQNPLYYYALYYYKTTIYDHVPQFLALNDHVVVDFSGRKVVAGPPKK